MSGIFGALALDGSQPSPSQLQPMGEQLARRAPDGTHFWNDGPVALGHALLATTPESLVESLPLTDPESGCTITADVRLDNRQALIAELGLDAAGRVIGDGELILRAYLRWDEECPEKLLGDFAFAIWDPRSQRLFCARDHMGMRQLIYHHHPGRLFAFATDVRAVLAFPGVPRRINEERIADFLDDLEGINLPSTFFEDVLRLPPAHRLTIGASGLELRRYWQLQSGAELKLENDEAYAKAFLDVFTEAVRCRLRSPGPVGSMLSGGIDSGSVVAVAAKLLAAEDRGPLHTFSAIGPDPETCIETRTILAASALPGLAKHFVHQADLGDLRRTLADWPADGDPFEFEMPLICAVYLAAHRQGVKVLLDGAASDLALTSGSRVGQLLRQGRILKAVREARAETRFWGPTWPAWKSIAHAAWAAWTPSIVRNIKEDVKARLASRRFSRSGLISPEFAKSIDFAARRRRSPINVHRGHPFSVEKRRQSILHPHLTAARERYDRVASAMAIEPRDPFMDVRLVEFCLSLPTEQLQSDGWPKLVLRRAMLGSLPDGVIWRRGKEHLGRAFIFSMFDGWAGWFEDVEAERLLLERFVRSDIFGGGNRQRGKALDIDERFKLFYLLHWLRRSRSGPPDTDRRLGKRHAKKNG